MGDVAGKLVRGKDILFSLFAFVFEFFFASVVEGFVCLEGVLLGVYV